MFPVDPHQFIVIGVIVFVIASLYLEWFRPATTFFIAAVALGISGVLTPAEILIGFSNEQVAVVMLLLIMGSVIQKSGMLDYWFDLLFRNIRSYKQFLWKMMAAVSTSSAFLNNTPMVAILAPYVHEWGKRTGIAPSRLLIPLSYAAILGGTATLIGTSTNLVINGMLAEREMETFKIFDFALVGLPLIVLGSLYMVFWGHRLLPDRKDVVEDFKARSREYIVETRIANGSPLAGKTVEEAALRQLRGLYLVEIGRQGQVIAPVTPGEQLQEGDVLLFAGEVEMITELLRKMEGLKLPKAHALLGETQLNLVESVVPYNSALAGKKLRDSDFRGKYDAAVIAVHRNGERISGKLGEIVIRTGDVLLLLTGADFDKRVVDTPNLYIISRQKKMGNVSLTKGLILIGGLLGAIALAAINILSLFIGLAILLATVVLLRIVPLAEVRKSFDFNLLFIIAFALALGKAMFKSGTADLAASGFIGLIAPLGALAVLAGIYLITNVLTEIMTNVAAASLTFPLALSVAASMGEPVMPFVFAVAYGASASFLTPVGYQTNLMVYGPGGYTFRDFFRVGLPMSLLYMVTTVLLLGYMYDLF